MSRSVLAFLASLILLQPIVVLTFATNLAVRLVVALLANAAFVFVVSVIAEVKIGELCMAGAAYAAVMIVYIAGSH